MSEVGLDNKAEWKKMLIISEAEWLTILFSLLGMFEISII